MKRLYLILGISHAILIAGAVSFFVTPSFTAAFGMISGLFIRGMIPYETVKESRRLERSISSLLTIIFANWLCGFGLSDVFEKAWQARFAARPLSLLTTCIVYLTVTDWLWLLNQTQESISEFYIPECPTKRSR